MGFVVSRAVGPAAVRNRVRRRLRALVRDRIVDLPEGSLLVVRANPPAATASYQDLHGDLDRVLGRLLGERTGGPGPRPAAGPVARAGPGSGGAGD